MHGPQPTTTHRNAGCTTISPEQTHIGGEHAVMPLIQIEENSNYSVPSTADTASDKMNGHGTGGCMDDSSIEGITYPAGSDVGEVQHKADSNPSKQREYDAHHIVNPNHCYSSSQISRCNGNEYSGKVMIYIPEHKDRNLFIFLKISVMI